MLVSGGDTQCNLMMYICFPTRLGQTHLLCTRGLSLLSSLCSSSVKFSLNSVPLCWASLNPRHYCATVVLHLRRLMNWFHLFSHSAGTASSVLLWLVPVIQFCLEEPTSTLEIIFNKSFGNSWNLGKHISAGKCHSTPYCWQLIYFSRTSLHVHSIVI